MERNQTPVREQGPRAIEVLSMFEDAIVDARHFDDPRAGTPRRGTRALLGGGAAALGLALVFFLVAYAQVVADRASGAALSGGGFLLDVTALLLVGGGVFAIAVGLARRAEERRPRDFTVGPDARALLHVNGEALPAAAFPLLRSTGTDYELVVAPAMRGEILVEGGRVYALADLIATGKARPSEAVPGAFALPIPNGSRARVDLSETTAVLLRPVPAPRRHPVPLRLDGGALRYALGTAAAAAALLALMFAIPPDPKSLALERLDQVRRLASFAIVPPVPPVVPAPEVKKDKPDEGGKKGRLARGTGGKMGDEKSKARDRRFQMKGPADNLDPHVAQQLAREAAKNAGALGILKADKGSPFASLFSTHESALGDAATDVLGNLVGTEVGDANGVPGGLGLVGSGIGGGPHGGDATIGVGTIGTVGVGDGTKPYGRGVARFEPRRQPRAPEVVVGQAQTVGMDKELIRRVIRQHINEIKFCYDRELQRNPDLYGRIIVGFSISPIGRVIASAVQSSTMSNRAVESCTVEAVRRWEFPKPERSGLVMVSYPFTFNRPGRE